MHEQRVWKEKAGGERGGGKQKSHWVLGQRNMFD